MVQPARMDLPDVIGQRYERWRTGADKLRQLGRAETQVPGTQTMVAKAAKKTDEIVEPVEEVEEVAEAPVAPPAAPPTGKRQLGVKEPIIFKWKILGQTEGVTLTLFKAVEREEADAQLERLQREGYYKELRIADISEKVVQPKPPPPTPLSSRAAAAPKRTKAAAKRASDKKVKSAAKAKVKPKAPARPAKKTTSSPAKKKKK